MELQEIRGPRGKGRERMWRGRWRDSGWKQRAGSGRTARARERPRAGEELGSEWVEGEPSQGIEGGRWEHWEPWSWADLRTPTPFPWVPGRAAVRSCWSLSQPWAGPRLQLHGDLGTLHIRPSGPEGVCLCLRPCPTGASAAGAATAVPGEAGWWGRLILDLLEPGGESEGTPPPARR